MQTTAPAQRHIYIPACLSSLSYASQVLCEPLDMNWLWQTLPAYAEFVQDLPVGESMAMFTLL
jgi:hypothetical protein